MLVESPPATLQNPPSRNGSAPFISQPNSVVETGLPLSLLADLMLKTIHFSGRPTAKQMGAQMAISFGTTQELITFLRQEQAIETAGTSGIGEQAYRYALTDRGRKMADEALRRSLYVGPAPVPFDTYVEILKQQSIKNTQLSRHLFAEGVSHLVLSKSTLAALGPAFSSGRSVLVYGASGNGKTSITMAVGKILPGEVLIPYAVEVHGQLVRVFDPRLHVRVGPSLTEERRQEEEESPPTGFERRSDARWVLAKRPMVAVGGELTLQDLELRYSASSQFYIAPLQWKANSGIFIVDDFGRQMIQPAELLNRWIVPMEQGVDHLTLHTGDTLELPFDVLLVFSSNIPPGDLGDEAFFRRIRHKVEIPNPTEAEFLQILKNAAADYGVDYSDEAAQHFLTKHYAQTGRAMKSCHPRDVIELVTDLMEFYGETPAMAPEWIDLACSSYFVDVPDQPGYTLRRAA
jgi:predicted ATPase with chaperone activity